MTQDFNSEAESLYAFLRGQAPADDHNLPSEEVELVAALRAAAQSIHADPQFQEELESRLKQAVRNRRPNPLQIFTRSLRWAAAAGMLIALAFGLTWVLRNLLPHPLSAAATALPTDSPTPTASQVSQPTQPTIPSAIPGQTLYQVPFMAGFQMELQAQFPESPAQASIYTIEPSEPATVENVKAMAAQLGVQGQVYTLPSEIQGKSNYLVTDGVSRLTFWDSPSSFYYVADYTAIANLGGELPPLEQRISIAEEFLKSHGLLDFPYQVETDHLFQGSVRFIPVLDGHPLRSSSFKSSLIDVEIDSRGQVKTVSFSMPTLTSLGQYPIRSVEEAWDALLSSETSRGVQGYEWTRMISNIQTWQREYPLGERVEMFGYLEVLESAESGGSPLLVFNNFPLAGNTQGMAETAWPGAFVQVWGQLQVGDNGLRVLNVEGWQVSPFVDKNIEGLVRREGELAYLQSADHEYLLPDLPDGVAEGQKVAVQGVVLEQPELTIDWSSISTAVSGMGGGGGGGGGLAFAELNLSGTPVPLPTPEPTLARPSLLGQRIEKERGQPFVTLHQYADGSLIQETTIYLEASESLPDGLFVTLEGASLAGIENYVQLPIYVWGEITGEKNNIPILTVERYEPVYPGLRIQAWLGTEEIVTLQGTNVTLLTTQEGEQFVLNSSIDVEPDSKIGLDGAMIFVEGIREPDKEFGGYPVINDLGFGLADKTTDPSQYPLSAATPPVIQESTLPGEPAVATIDTIELAYLGQEPLEAEGAIPYVQPIWRFAGSFSDGRLFEFFVQALRDEYLK